MIDIGLEMISATTTVMTEATMILVVIAVTLVEIVVAEMVANNAIHRT
jgi:hypothetical protein